MFDTNKRLNAMQAEIEAVQTQIDELMKSLRSIEDILAKRECAEVKQKNIESQARKQQNNGEYKNGTFLRSFSPDEQFYPEENAPKDR